MHGQCDKRWQDTGGANPYQEGDEFLATLEEELAKACARVETLTNALHLRHSISQEVRAEALDGPQYGTLEQVESALEAEGTDMLSKPEYHRQCTRCGSDFRTTIYEASRCQVCSTAVESKEHRSQVRRQWLRAMADDSYARGQSSGLRRGMLWGLLIGAALGAATLVGSEVLGIALR